MKVAWIVDHSNAQHTVMVIYRAISRVLDFCLFIVKPECGNTGTVGDKILMITRCPAHLHEPSITVPAYS